MLFSYNFVRDFFVFFCFFFFFLDFLDTVPLILLLFFGDFTSSFSKLNTKLASGQLIHKIEDLNMKNLNF